MAAALATAFFLVGLVGLGIGAMIAWAASGPRIVQALRNDQEPDWSRDESAWLRELDANLARETEALDRPFRS